MNDINDLLGSDPVAENPAKAETPAAGSDPAESKAPKKPRKTKTSPAKTPAEAAKSVAETLRGSAIVEDLKVAAAAVDEAFAQEKPVVETEVGVEGLSGQETPATDLVPTGTNDEVVSDPPVSFEPSFPGQEPVQAAAPKFKYAYQRVAYEAALKRKR